MILPNPKDALHKAWLYRVLTAISDNNILSQYLHFKGGTAAAMLGYLDRFSVDLDFEVSADFDSSHLDLIRTELENIFKKLGLKIKDSSTKIPQYFLKYDAASNTRNTIKVEVTTMSPKANNYEIVKLPEIDRFFSCETIETMFANKLVSILDRYERNTSIATRDLYDIHHFFLQGYSYNENIITERRNTTLLQFFEALISFIEIHINNKKISQDLNPLVPHKKFQLIRKILKEETLMFLRGEKEKIFS